MSEGIAPFALVVTTRVIRTRVGINTVLGHKFNGVFASDYDKINANAFIMVRIKRQGSYGVSHTAKGRDVFDNVSPVAGW